MGRLTKKYVCRAHDPTGYQKVRLEDTVNEKGRFYPPFLKVSIKLER